jgi:transcriptional regulator with XRE-family HTH domain
MAEAHEVFRQLRKSKRMTMKDVAEKGNIGSTTLWRFENGRNSLPTDILLHLLDVMGYTFAEFAARLESDELPERGSMPVVKFVPVRSWKHIEDADSAPLGTVAYHNETQAETFALKVRDESMLGKTHLFPVGSYAIAIPASEARNDDLVIVERAGSYHFRQYQDGHFVPDNGEFETFPEENTRVVALVTGEIWCY